MAKRKPLHSLQRLSAHAADAASREIGTRLRALRAEEARLTQVGSYVDQYETLSGTATADLTVGTLLGRRRFVGRLHEAAVRQRQVVAEEDTRYRQQIEQWRDARAQALALQRFNERLRQREREQKEQGEQQMLDDMGRRPRP